MPSDHITFAGVELAPGRKPVIFAVLGDELSVEVMENWAIDEALTCLKEYQNLWLCINLHSLQHEQTLCTEFRKKIKRAGFKSFSVKGNVNRWMETSAQDCFRALIGQTPLPPARWKDVSSAARSCTSRACSFATRWKSSKSSRASNWCREFYRWRIFTLQGSWTLWWRRTWRGWRLILRARLRHRVSLSCQRENKAFPQMKIRLGRGVSQRPMRFGSIPGLDDGGDAAFDRLVIRQDRLQIDCPIQSKQTCFLSDLERQPLNARLLPKANSAIGVHAVHVPVARR